jgi:outer membrane protein
MKTGFVLALMLFLSSTVVFGQLESGNIFIQGSSSLGFSTEKYTYINGGTSTESSKTTYFDFNPKVGYFIIDNLPAGLAIDLSTAKTKAIDGDDESTNNSFTIGPFVRYYFLPQDKLKPMGEAYVGFGGAKDKYKYASYTYESKYGIIQFRLGAGGSYFITDNVAFDMLISYNSCKYKLKSESSPVKSTASEDSSDKYTGIGINFGIVVIIPN